jgi:hypothetical protein
VTRLVVLAAVVAVAPGAGRAATGQARATSDRQDDVTGPQVHFLYVLPRDGEDRALDATVIARSVAVWQRWLAAETGGRALRVDTYQGDLDITFFRLRTNDATVAARREFVREQIEEELFAAGFGSPTKIYAVYYDGSSTWSCGGADPQPTYRGAVAALYLKGTPPGAPACATNALGGDPPGYLEFAMLHELVHTLGFVPRCAPHARGDFDAGHVSDSTYDLMWSGPEPWGTYRPDLMKLDVGRDDYYGHGRADCADLAASAYLTDVAAPLPPEQEPEPSPHARVVSFTATQPARAGRPFEAVLLLDMSVRGATCQATVGGRRLPARKAIGARTASCRWRLPTGARGSRLSGSVRAATAGGDVTRTFARRVR